MNPTLGGLSGIVLLLGLAACGGGSEPAAPSSPGPAQGVEAPASSADTGAEKKPDAPASGWPYISPTPDERRTQLERLQREPGPLKSNWTPPGKNERYGHAEALIPARYDAVRARVADFAHYKELAGPKFKKVSVVDRQPTTTDLYFQLPIMKGVVTIWYVARFAPPKPAPGEGEIIEGEFVKGNIKGMHFVFTVRPGPDPQSAILACDLLLSLNMMAPQGEVDQALRDACGDAVRSVRTQTTTAAAAPPAP